MPHASIVLMAVALVLPAWPPPRNDGVLVLTDIENEPDDAMSTVRFLTYTNQWDVEGLVATTSVHQRDKTAAWRIREIVEAYRKVRDNLENTSLATRRPTTCSRCFAKGDRRTAWPRWGRGWTPPAPTGSSRRWTATIRVRSGFWSGADRTAWPRRSGNCG
jgi:hypothetical protein